MSSEEEIRLTYEQDINRMSYLVEKTYGKGPFYDNFKGMSVRNIKEYDPSATKYQGEK